MSGHERGNARPPWHQDHPRGTTVLYIGGSGRSGSTLLECLLAELPEVVALGEVGHLWERALGRNELCACGEHFHDCPFWTVVGQRAFGGWKNVSVEHVLTLKDAVDRQRRMPSTARRRAPRGMRTALQEYAEYYRRIYQAAATVSGAPVVVDSSKVAPTALAVSHDPQIDLRTMHIVRDSRGVAYSWSKKVSRPETGGTEDMPQLDALHSVALWLSHNLSISALRYRQVPVTRMRYEDLVLDARGTVAEAWRALDLPGPGQLPMVDARTVDLHPTHSVAGNPMRFRTGRTTLRPDEAWRHSMTPRDRRIVTTVTLPLLKLWGYRITARSPS